MTPKLANEVKVAVKPKYKKGDVIIDTSSYEGTTKFYILKVSKKEYTYYFSDEETKKSNVFSLEIERFEDGDMRLETPLERLL